MSIREWGELEGAGELVDGRLEEEEMASFVHELVVGWLIAVLRAWLVPRGGFVFGSDAKYAVLSDRGRKADLSAFFAGRRPPPTGVCPIAPDLVVEVVTPTPRDARRDRIEKLGEYARFGIRWYWLIDPQLRTLEILELGSDGRYAHALDVAAGTHEIPGCAGLVLELDALWAEVERLERDEPA